ncbi:MAG: hypothetical protein ACXWW0_14475, partial [Bacteroidia bacterium]
MRKPINLLLPVFIKTLNISKFLYILLMLHICLCPKMLLAAQDSTVYSTPRLPSQSSIEKFQQDPEFDYREKPQGDTPWHKFLRWLKSIFNINPGTYANTFLNRDLWYILFAVVIIAVIYTFFKSDIQGLFYKSSPALVEMQVLEEDINTLNFDGLIDEA